MKVNRQQNGSRITWHIHKPLQRNKQNKIENAFWLSTRSEKGARKTITYFMPLCDYLNEFSILTAEKWWTIERWEWNGRK